MRGKDQKANKKAEEKERKGRARGEEGHGSCTTYLNHGKGIAPRKF